MFDIRRISRSKTCSFRQFDCLEEVLVGHMTLGLREQDHAPGFQCMIQLPKEPGLIGDFMDDGKEQYEIGNSPDIPILLAFSTLMTLGGLYLASLGLTWAAAYFSFSGPGDIAGLPALGFVLGAFGLITQPLGNLFSRWRERLADEYSLQSTAKPAAFASAFIRLANQNLGEVDPEKWVVFMFYDHPPLGERIKMAEEKSGVLLKGINT